MKHKLTLLFGMPRSGTTWIAKIFDSHPDTLYRHEPDTGGILNAIPFFAGVERWEAYSGIMRNFINQLPKMNSIRVAGSLPIFAKNYLSNTRVLMQRFAVLASRAVEPVARELPVPSFAKYDQNIPPHIVWKSIESTGRLGLIARAVPECRAILILRHPCAYIASVLSGESQRRFDDSAPVSEDYEVLAWALAASPPRSNHPSLASLQKLEPVERLAWLWVLTNEKAIADMTGAENCAYVRYEDVCADPFAKAWEMLDFAGLPWDPQVKAFIERSTSHHSDRYYSVFKDPAIAANKWQSQLSHQDIKRVMEIVNQSRLAKFYPERNNIDKTYVSPLAPVQSTASRKLNVPLTTS